MPSDDQQGSGATNTSLPVSGPWALHLAMSSVRGIDGYLSIDLDPDGKGEGASTVLLYGENGSGKSSICDAFEFAVRGTISRRDSGGRKQRRELKNIRTHRAPAVSLRLSDQKHVSRGPKGALSGSPTDGALEDFQYAPVVIRRRAIETFWGMDAEDRLDLFWDYFQVTPAGRRSQKDEQILAEHSSLRNAVSKKAEMLGPLAQRAWQEFTGDKTKSLILPQSVQALDRVRSDLSRTRLWKKNRGELKHLFHEYGILLKGEQELRSGAETARRKSPRENQIRKVLEAAEAAISQDFHEIATHSWLQEASIHFTFGKTPSHLNIMLQPPRAKSVAAEMVLSEAYLDLLALLVMVEVQIATRNLGQAPIVIFDDVFQSVDAPLRQKTLKVLTNRLEGWQMIVTSHDRLWIELAERTLKQAGRRTIHSISVHAGQHGAGPVILSNSSSPLRDVEFVLNNHGSAVLLAGAVGRATEALLEEWSLAFAVKMRRRKFYMIQQLMDALSGTVSNAQNPDVKKNFKRLKEAQFLRNRIGAHYNPLGETISSQEARGAAEGVIFLWNYLTCPDCGAFATMNEVGSGKWEPSFPCCSENP